tara:strand:- start:209 stop:1309 length:1101 start_codon:yes stop_codon:yes gene_type:complete
MKRVRITNGSVGLVFKNGELIKVLEKGTHWLFFNEMLIRYDLTKRLELPVAFEMVKDCNELIEMLHVVEVKDQELVLVFENGNFREVLTSGRHLFWNKLLDYNFIKADMSQLEIPKEIDNNLLSRYELARFVRVFEVSAHEEALLMIDDVYTQKLNAGIYRFWKNDTSVKIARVDLRHLQLEVSGQELLTKDKAAIRINFFANHKVVNSEKAILDNKDYSKQLYVALQLSLRAFVGQYTLDELLSNKVTIAESVFTEVLEVTEDLGVLLLSCGIKDVILTGEMKDIMNQVLIAEKRAQASVITRREETASTRSLLNTAKLMADNEMLYKLKEMEYVEKIADKIGEITLNGNGGMVKQLKEIFAVNT